MGTAAACVNANRRCAGLRTVVLFPSWLRHSLWHSPVPGLTSWGGAGSCPGFSGEPQPLWPPGQQGGAGGDCLGGWAQGHLEGYSIGYPRALGCTGPGVAGRMPSPVIFEYSETCDLVCTPVW